MFRKLSAEFIGTFWLIFIGSGSGILAATFAGIAVIRSEDGSGKRPPGT